MNTHKAVTSEDLWKQCAETWPLPRQQAHFLEKWRLLLVLKPTTPTEGPLFKQGHLCDSNTETGCAGKREWKGGCRHRGASGSTSKVLTIENVRKFRFWESLQQEQLLGNPSAGGRRVAAEESSLPWRSREEGCVQRPHGTRSCSGNDEQRGLRNRHNLELGLIKFKVRAGV